MLPDLRIGPVPPVAPVKCFAHGPVALAIQLGKWLLGARYSDAGEIAGRGLELGAVLQLEIGPSDMHVEKMHILPMTFNKMGTLPLPLALHLATHTVIGLFCAFAGGLNLIRSEERRVGKGC